VPATEVIQGIYFVGQAAWTSGTIKTGDVIVIIDTMCNAVEAEKIIVAGTESFTFNGSDINMSSSHMNVLITMAAPHMYKSSTAF
jgi:hypothetical protein